MKETLKACKNTYLTLLLTEVDYGKQTEFTTCGLNNTFQTTGRQCDFRPNNMWVMFNYQKKKKKKVRLVGDSGITVGRFWVNI